jgi:acetyltransferase-like isoleucine patch superfamily enzyme
VKNFSLNFKHHGTFFFGTYTFFEKIFWSVVSLFPKFARKPLYKIVFKSFGKNVFIDEKCYFRYPWKISIGNNVTINRGCSFFPSAKNLNSYIELSDGVILGPNVTFFGAGQNPRDPKNIDISASIYIGENSYIGGNSTIRYGVNVGGNSTVGAGSVVISSLDSNSVYAGNPARFVRNSL